MKCKTLPVSLNFSLLFDDRMWFIPRISISTLSRLIRFLIISDVLIERISCIFVLSCTSHCSRIACMRNYHWKSALCMLFDVPITELFSIMTSWRNANCPLHTHSLIYHKNRSNILYLIYIYDIYMYIITTNKKDLLIQSFILFFLLVAPCLFSPAFA